MHGFLHEMRNCCIFRCAENRCWGCRELKPSLSSIWSSVLAYVWHRMLFFFFFFFFFFFLLLFFHSDLPSTHCTDRPTNIVFVRPSVRPFFRSQFMNLQPSGIDLCNFRKYPGKIYLIKTMRNKQKR